MLLDIVIAGLLVVTSGYCWRLNRRMSAFRNAKQELEQMIRSFDTAIRQAYESIAILKENSSDKNIQLIRDMEKVRFLANDLAYLVEKGEKLADELEANVRQPRFDFGEPAGLSATRAKPQQTPPSLPARQAVRPAAARPQAPAKPREAAPHMHEVKQMIDTLARSYVTDPAPTTERREAPRLQQQRTLQQYTQQPQRTQQQKTQAIEKMLSQLNREMTIAESRTAAQPQKPAAAAAARPAQPPRQFSTPAKAAAVAPAAKAVAGGRSRFFDSLRVVTPNE